MGKLIAGIAIGIVVTLIAGAAIGYLIITSGVIPARQDEVSSDFESWAAHQSLRATIKREAVQTSPIKADEENLMAGVKIYTSNCSGCHGTPKDPSPAFAKGYNPAPPLFANGETVTDDPEAKIYWKIDHGIRFTGMPSYNKMLNENEMWQVTLFLKNQDKLPKAVDDYWKTAK